MVVDDPWPNPGAQSHHPGCARSYIAGPMMLKAVSSGVLVAIASKVRQDEQSCVSSVFRFALHCFPEFRAQAIRAANGVHVERVSARVRDIDVVHGNPKQTR